LAAYREMATLAGGIWLEHGALEYRECIAEDVKPGKVTSFPQAVQLKKNETVVFSWIVYKSRADRDRINKKVMADPRLASMMDPKKMPFDGMRMMWGGFDVLVAFDLVDAKPAKKSPRKAPAKKAPVKKAAVRATSARKTKK
jgi:uncharacterized protein YbaA (DUF1428 family)